MAIVIVIVVCVAVVLSGYFLIKDRHQKEMAELAADCSRRIQQISRELTVVCTEESSIEAYEIKLRIRLNVSAEQMVWNGSHKEKSYFRGIHHLVKENV